MRIPGLLVTLALAIAPSPQIWGSKLPKSRNGHAGDSTSLHDPIIDLSRVMLEHPQTGIQRRFSSFPIPSEVELQRSKSAKAQPFFWDVGHNQCAGRITRT